MHMLTLPVQNWQKQSRKEILIQSPKQSISFTILGATIKGREKACFLSISTTRHYLRKYDEFILKI